MNLFDSGDRGLTDQKQDVVISKTKFRNLKKSGLKKLKKNEQYPLDDEVVFYLSEKLINSNNETKQSIIPLFGFYFSSSNKESEKMIAESLEKIAKIKNFRSLTNSVIPAELANAITINLLKVKTIKKENENSTTFSGADTELIEIRSSDMAVDQGLNFQLQLKNNSNRDLFITLFDIGTDGSIQIIHPISGGPSEILGSKAEIETNIYRFTAPPGIETYKVIASTKPIDLRFLEQGSVKNGIRLSALEMLFGMAFGTRNADIVAEIAEVDSWMTFEANFLISDKITDEKPKIEIMKKGQN